MTETIAATSTAGERCNGHAFEDIRYEMDGPVASSPSTGHTATTPSADAPWRS